MSFELIHSAISKGAKVYSNVSGGKDGQAMTASLVLNKIPVTGLVHADLGKVEWKESVGQCQKLSNQFNIPLYIVKRSDGLGLLEYMKRRMFVLEGTGKPFWPSSEARYCTSDLKRGPINVFYTSTNEDFIVSAEGIRADESTARKKKVPITIRSNSSSFYDGMTVSEAIINFHPGKKLYLTWYPIFNYSLDQVWSTYSVSSHLLEFARIFYKLTGRVVDWWPFHIAYVFGNNRISCKFCVLGSPNDLSVGAQHDDDGLLDELIEMQEYSGFTFKDKWSLTELKDIKPAIKPQLSLF